MATQMFADRLNGIQKASILIMSLGASASSEVFKYLNDQEIEVLTTEMIHTQGIDSSARDAVLLEFERRCASGRAKIGSVLELVAED